MSRWRLASVYLKPSVNAKTSDSGPVPEGSYWSRDVSDLIFIHRQDGCYRAFRRADFLSVITTQGGFMGVLINHVKPVSSWISRELEFSKTLKRGDRNRSVNNIQEWLCLHGQRVVVDGDFGSATHAGVREFQRVSRLKVDGVVGRKTYEALVAPLGKVLSPLPARRPAFLRRFDTGLCPAASGPASPGSRRPELRAMGAALYGRP